MPGISQKIWDQRDKYTSARIGLDQNLLGQSTKCHLELIEAQALARNSVLGIWDVEKFVANLEVDRARVFIGKSEAIDRESYLKFPERGKRMHSGTKKKLKDWWEHKKEALNQQWVMIVTNGLSSNALKNSFLCFFQELEKSTSNSILDLLKKPIAIIIIENGRVAIGDEIGELLHLDASLVVVGERPGMSSYDSLGLYLTFEPNLKKQDSERNCISNIRSPGGLSAKNSAKQALYLLCESFHIGKSGVDLKLDLDKLDQWYLKNIRYQMNSEKIT